MKFGNFEGTPQELKDVCENHGFDPNSFLSSPPRFRPKLWVMFLLMFLFITLSILMWIAPMSNNVLKALIVINLVLIITSSIAVQLKFENSWVTAIAFLGGLLVTSICLNYITPKDAIKELKEKAVKSDK